MNFDVYWKERGKKFWKEHFSFEGATPNSIPLAIVVNPDNQISTSQRSIPVTESRVSCSKSMKSSSSAYNWNYVILVKEAPQETVLG